MFERDTRTIEKLEEASTVLDASVAANAAEVTRRRTEARRLRSSAGAEWSAAKARFEQELWGNILSMHLWQIPII